MGYLCVRIKRLCTDDIPKRIRKNTVSEQLSQMQEVLSSNLGSAKPQLETILVISYLVQEYKL